MAYWIDENSASRDGSSRQTDFYADDVSDIANLPTHSHVGVQQGEDTISYQKVDKGSSCLVIGSGQLFILNSEDEWIGI